MSAYDDLTEDQQRLVDQVTLRKLEYARQELRNCDRPASGSKAVVRERLAQALSDGAIDAQDLQGLLEELELWGDQRVRFLRFPARAKVLAGLRIRDWAAQRTAELGWPDLFEAEHRVSDSPDLEPLWAEYGEENGVNYLRVVAGKARKVEQRLKDVEERPHEDLPGVFWIPYKREIKNALTFCEIDLKTGDVLLSTSKISHGEGYDHEFAEFIELTAPLLDLGDCDRLCLHQAVRAINQGLENCQRHACDVRTAQQSKLQAQGRGLNYDFATDPDVADFIKLGHNMDHVFANCSWQPDAILVGAVHTLVYAPKGEVTILQQIREPEARHVLQRILFLN